MTKARRKGVGLPTHRPPTSPGQMLKEEFLEPLGLTQTELAERMGVPVGRVNQILQERRTVSTDTALRLSRVPARIIHRLVWRDWVKAHQIHARRAPRKLAAGSRRCPVGEDGASVRGLGSRCMQGAAYERACRKVAPAA
jgi:addiction module HigA family antidote